MAAPEPPTRMGGYEELFAGSIATLTADSTPEEVIKVYDEWAADYDKEVVDLAQYQVPRAISECMDRALKQVYPDKTGQNTKIIDLGAGTGQVGVQLKKLGYVSVDALDISPQMLHEAKKKNAYQKFICAPISDQRIDEIKTGEYCVGMCVGTLLLNVGHVGPAAFDEMNRIVKDGGLLCFNIHDDELHRYEDKIRELEKAKTWKPISKERIPYMDHAAFPRESNAFVYQVVKS